MEEVLPPRVVGTWGVQTLVAGSCGEAHTYRLVVRYRSALRRWMRKRVRISCGLEEPQTVALLDAAGPPAQSWYLNKLWEGRQNRQQGLNAHERDLLESEVLEFSARNGRDWTGTPPWAEAYFDEEKGLRAGKDLVMFRPTQSEGCESTADGWRLLAEAWPDAGRLVSETVSRVVRYTGSRPGYTGSTPKAFGAVFVAHSDRGDLPLHVRYAVTLVHETAHLALHAARCTGPFLETGEGESLYSPFRRESRTALGVIHSAYALSGMIELVSRIADLQCGKWRREVLEERERLAETLRQTTEAIAGLEWTALGMGVYSYVRNVATIMDAR